MSLSNLPHEPQPQPATLRESYDEVEQQAELLAEQHRQLASKPTQAPGDAEALKERLIAKVEQAFEVRQDLQRAEIGEFRRRITRIEQTIEIERLENDIEPRLHENRIPVRGGIERELNIIERLRAVARDCQGRGTQCAAYDHRQDNRDHRT